MIKIESMYAAQGVRFLTRTFTNLKPGVDGVVSLVFDPVTRVVVINDNILIPIGPGMQLEMEAPWQMTGPSEEQPGANSSSKSDDQVRATGKQQKPR